jgi:hypothetical protein
MKRQYPLLSEVSKKTSSRSLTRTNRGGDDIAPPKVDTTPSPTSPPSGPMTQDRVKALHDKVNTILSTLDLDTTLDGVLPHSDMLCVIRYKC